MVYSCWPLLPLPRWIMDTPSPKEQSEQMARVRSKDTKPEMAVRRPVRGMGYRYRLRGRQLPGRRDMVFASRRKVIFVHGCFWHRHNNCKLARLPKSKLDFWLPKLERNREHDREIQEVLRALDWMALTVPEFEVSEQESLARRINTFLT